MKFRFFLLSCLLISGGCTYSVHLVQNSEDVPLAQLGQGHAIRAEASQFVIMGFVAQTDYVNHAYSSLQSQCQGPIYDITTKFYTDHGFFSWTNHVSLEAQCLSN